MSNINDDQGQGAERGKDAGWHACLDEIRKTPFVDGRDETTPGHPQRPGVPTPNPKGMSPKTHTQAPDSKTTCVSCHYFSPDARGVLLLDGCDGGCLYTRSRPDRKSGRTSWCSHFRLRKVRTPAPDSDSNPLDVGLTIPEARTAFVEEIFEIGWNAGRYGSDKKGHLDIAHNTFPDILKRYLDCLESHSVVPAPVRWQRSCLIVSPGRGDCFHLLGLPAEENERTTDTYGRPHGWCEICWLGEMVGRKQEEIVNLKDRIGESEVILRKAKEESTQAFAIRKNGYLLREEAMKFRDRGLEMRLRALKIREEAKEIRESAAKKRAESKEIQGNWKRCEDKPEAPEEAAADDEDEDKTNGELVAEIGALIEQTFPGSEEAKKGLGEIFKCLGEKVDAEDAAAEEEGEVESCSKPSIVLGYYSLKGKYAGLRVPINLHLDKDGGVIRIKCPDEWWIDFAGSPLDADGPFFIDGRDIDLSEGKPTTERLSEDLAEKEYKDACDEMDERVVWKDDVDGIEEPELFPEDQEESDKNPPAKERISDTERLKTTFIPPAHWGEVLPVKRGPGESMMDLEEKKEEAATEASMVVYKLVKLRDRAVLSFSDSVQMDLDLTLAIKVAIKKAIDGVLAEKNGSSL